MAVSETSPMDIVRSLRSRASHFTVLADAFDGVDQRGAAVAREEAVQLRCRAAVVEQLSELYDELRAQMRLWDEFMNGLRGLS